MSYQKTPLRSRSSLGSYSTTTGSGSSLSRSGSNPTPGAKPHVKVTDLRRPPSSRGFHSGSPQPQQKQQAPRSRPGSAMGYFSGGSSSRPPTPSFQRLEPYTGSITVSIRPNPYSVHPFQPAPWDLDVRENSISNKQDQSSFSFDNVFPADASTTNSHVYQKSCSEIVKKFLHEGYNGTVFAYGMTGSGKTFSMRGENHDPGFVKLAIDDIFHIIESNSMSKIQYKLNVSYLEIYNEKIIDLLSTNPSSNGSDLKIRDDSMFGNKIVGITSPDIISKEQLLSLIKRGDTNRKTSATDFNARSSRSHSILQLKLTTIDIMSNSEQNATLSLCDLAGSERATSSLERRKEGAYINKSLLALSTVINKLSASASTSANTPAPPPSSEHIPYRDSKLTRLLQPALSGSSLISILCTIHLGSGSESTNSNNQFISETYNTLRFAARARNIVMNVSRNKSSSLGESPETLKLIEELRRTVETQKTELQLLQNHNGMTGISNNTSTGLTEQNLKISQLEGENAILNEKLEHLTRLTDLQKTETIILKNDTLNDLLGSGIENNASQVMMSNLEEFYKRVNYEMDEYKSYINHLENQLELQHSKNSLSRGNETSKTLIEPSVPDPEMEAVLKDQEEEIWHLKELIKDKDHIIKSLTKTTKLRRLMESNSANVLEKSEDHASKRTSVRNLDANDKENSTFGELKSFKISGSRSPDIEESSRFVM
ncbi:kinesin-like protein Kip2p [[Candida] anglica]|uniref:Kinesin-like protein n=1 Tax=[Candida] anglica TaxID=148631 RepID=A0ABP0EJD8_9ASCO